MLITKRTYKQKYVIGDAGIFDSIGSFFARMFASNAAKQLASTALQAGKSAAKDIGMKVIDVGETVAIDAGKKLVEKAAKKLSTHKPQVAYAMINGGDIRISIESQDMVAHPSESYLIFEGRLTKADNTAYANTDEVALTNNAIFLAELSITYQTS